MQPSFSDQRTSDTSSVSFSDDLLLIDDERLILRIMAAYKYAVSAFGGHGDSMWAAIIDRSRQLHLELLRNDVPAVTERLRYPANNDLLCGFDEATKTIYSEHHARGAAGRENWGETVYSRLVRLAESTGAISLRKSHPTQDTEGLLRRLDDKFGFAVDFPNPYPDELGLKTSRGLANHRAVLALYQAWRVAHFIGQNGHTRILEIGAGSGRTAYYSRKFGLRDYTIVDLPMTNVAQANFLGRVLGPSVLILSNENDDPANSNAIRIFGPLWLEKNSSQFDVALNADSLTEIDHRQAFRYFSQVARCCSAFISINHEENGFRVNDLPILAGAPLRFSRYPYWLDDGYVEEVFLFRTHAAAPLNLHTEAERLGSLILDQQDQIKLQHQTLQSGRALLRELISIAIRRVRAFL
jgi:hypothetical protein